MAPVLFVNSEGYRTFPRGMVLGLTMAETVLLIVFALLLAFAALFTWQQDEARQEVETLEDHLADHGIAPQNLGPAEDRARTDGERWRELVRVVELDIEDTPPDAILVHLEVADQWRDENSPVRRLGEALHESGVDVSPLTLSQLVEVTEIARESGMTPQQLQSRLREAGAQVAADKLSETLNRADLEPTSEVMHELAEMARISADAGMTPARMLEEISAAGDDLAAQELREALGAADLPVSPEEMRNLAELARVSADTGVSPRGLSEAIGTTGRDRAMRDLRRALNEAGVEPAAAELQELAEMAEALADAGLTPQEVRHALESDPGRDAALKRLGRVLEDAGVGATLEAISELSELASVAAEVGRTPDAIRDLLIDPDGGGGRGTEHPSCLRNARNSPAYLFDVALSAEGYLLQSTRAPRYATERSKPPPIELLAAVETGFWLQQEQFVRQTLPIRRWSDANECVLFVRVWDQTSSAEKQLYKDRMRVLEAVFYKFEGSSDPPPTSDQSRPGQ